MGESTHVEWSERWFKTGWVAGCVVGDGPAVCVVCKDGCEEALCRVEDLRCGSGESGRTVADGVEGFWEDVACACDELSRSCVREIEVDDGGVRGKVPTVGCVEVDEASRGKGGDGAEGEGVWTMLLEGVIKGADT